MVRDPHSWMAAGRASPVFCTQSGSLEGTKDKGERCWESMGGAGKMRRGLGLTQWDSLPGQSSLGEVRCSGSWGRVGSGGHQPLGASEGPSSRLLHLPLAITVESKQGHTCGPYPSL